MNIGFDGRFMAVQGGLGRYCSELLKHLSARYPEDNFTVLAATMPPSLARANIHHMPSDTPWYGIAEQTLLGLTMNACPDVALWHIPHWNVPLFLRRPFIMTIHDTIAEKYSTHDGTRCGRWRYYLKRYVWRCLLGLNIRRARAIITISRTVRDELVERFPAAAHKITVIHNGVSFFPAVGLPHEPPPPHPYFLIVGNSYPHKNHDVALRAFAYVAERDEQVHLNLVTHEDRFSRAAAVRASLQPHAHRIHFLFDANDEELALQYAHARALIFPSLAEGFGLPPLEALGAGTPVLAVQTPVARELLEPHVIWMDPHNAHALADQLFELLTAPRRASTDAMRHAHSFTWSAGASATHALYKNVL